MKYLPDIRATVRQVLIDEFVEGTDFEWKDDEIDIHIGLCLQEVSEVSPYEVKETLYITSRSGTATSTLENHLVDATKEHFVADDVGKSIYNTTDRTTALITVLNSTTDVTLDTNIMASGEGYELWDTDCASAKEINIGSITDLLDVTHVEYLTRQSPKRLRNANLFGDVLTIDMNATPTDAYPVFVYCNKVHQLTEYGSTLNPQAERVLIEGAAAHTALTWTNQIRIQVRNAITSVAEVNASIDNMTGRIEQAVDDLIAGRLMISATRDTAEGVIDDMTGRIEQAVDDLIDGRAFINTISYGGRPESDYAAYASRELANALSYLNQARGYLSVDTPSREYSNYAARELSSAGTYLNQAGGYIRELTTRLSISGVINTYQVWANNKLALYQDGLRRLSKFQTYRTYPKD